MIAFLPALSLAAYWTGGEALLIFCSLCVPLLYAATGGLGATTRPGSGPVPDSRSVEELAQDFLDIAGHHGQTAGCLQISVAGLVDISEQFGAAEGKTAADLVARRLASGLRDADHVVQTGDARFVVLVSPSFRLKLDSLLDLAQRLRSTVEEPLAVSGTTRHLSAAIGIAASLSLGRNASAATWLDAAAMALSEANRNGTSATRAWSDKLARSVQNRRNLRDDLAKALDNGEIQAFFQPQVSLRTGRLIGMEALARWDHPTRGIVPPADFLGALEDGGEMERLGQTMLAQSLAALDHWDKTGFEVPTVSVNFSEVELRNPGLAEHVRWELERFGFPAHRLVVEVLETVLCDGRDDIVYKSLLALSELGCLIALDDFGTARSCIGSLQSWPISRVKIDHSFVRGADRSDECRRLISAILAMVETLGLECLAEGVETLSEQGVLRDLGCPYAQGFIFGAPMSVAETETWLSTAAEAERQTSEAGLRRVN